MTLDQLKYFETAANTLHIGKAAQLLNISQPSLSISIKKLEAELEVPLFQSEGRGIALTSYGRDLLPYARSILQQTEAAKKHLKKEADKLNMEIHFAYTASIAYLCIPRLFRDFMAATKGKYLIYSDEMPSDKIAEGIKEGRFDLGICSRIEPDPDIVQIPIIYQPFVLILPSSAPYAGLDFATPEDIQEIPFVSYLTDYPMYRQVSGLFQKYVLTPQITHFAYSEDSIAQLVSQELGISIVAETESLASYENIRILRPSWLTDGRYLYLTYHRLRHQGDGARAMTEFVKNFWKVSL